MEKMALVLEILTDNGRECTSLWDQDRRGDVPDDKAGSVECLGESDMSRTSRFPEECQTCQMNLMSRGNPGVSHNVYSGLIVSAQSWYDIGSIGIELN